MAETPTYYKTQERDGTEVFHCIYCETQGLEHHSADPELFAQHMAQRHDGRMVSTPGGQKPEAPAVETEASPDETPAPPPADEVPEPAPPVPPAPPPEEADAFAEPAPPQAEPPLPDEGV